MYKHGFKTWAEKTALRLRKKMGRLHTDSLDMWEVAKAHGVFIWHPEDIPGLDEQTLQVLLKDDSESWSALTIKLEEKTVFVLNSTHTKPRQASNLAHEVSHLIIGHSGAKNYMTPDGLLLAGYNKDEEDEANWLAGCLLLPREACIYIKKKKLSEAQAMKKYGVSKEMLQYRMNVTGVAKEY